MSESPDVVKKFQDGLEPYIKPREQANYIRRILALHLASHSQDGPLTRPLALAGTPHDDISVSKDVKGLHREYLDALQANLAARRQYEETVQTRPQAPEIYATDQQHIDPLEQRLAILKLQQKRQKLSTVRKYLDQLVDQPAAAPDFLDADKIFEGAPQLPNVPREVVNSLAAETSASTPDLKTQTNQLEKVVLRVKLQLRKEEKLLEEAKLRSSGRSDIVSNGVRLEALSATRTELINWIESELSKTSGDETNADPQTGMGEKGGAEVDHATIQSGLNEIKQKYARYVQSRRDLLTLVSARPQATAAPVLKPAAEQAAPEPISPPVNHLLVPYIERLLASSRSQKALITQKSHLNAALNKQTKETYQGLGHLAEESQLLPAHPMKESLRRRSGLVEELTSKKTDRPEIANRVKPWVFASDAAKIANLESVAETVEGGQLALEGSMNALQELEGLLGLEKEEEPKNPDETGDEDTWLAAETSKGADARKHTEKQKTLDRKPGDVWSALHGNLGLIGQDDTM